MALQGANAERRSGWAPSLVIRGGEKWYASPHRGSDAALPRSEENEQ